MEKSHSNNDDVQKATLKFKFIFVVIMTIGTISCQKNSEPPVTPVPPVEYDSLVYQWLVNE